MTTDQIEKIESYLNGDMDAEEQNNFRQELETDPALAAAYNTYVAIETDMRSKKEYASENILHNTLAKLGTEFFGSSSNSNNEATNNTKKAPVLPSATAETTRPKISFFPNISKWKLAAAVFLGVIMTGTLYLSLRNKNIREQVAATSGDSTDSLAGNKTRNDTASRITALPNLVLRDTVNKQHPAGTNDKQQQLFAKYFTPDNLPTEKESPLAEAFVQYEHKQYASAALAFEDASSDLTTRGEETDNPLTGFYASYYGALSNMAMGRHNKAIKQLIKLSAPTSFLKTKVRWYIALEYVHTGNIEKAISILETISKNKGMEEYSSKANNLLIELRR